MQYLRRAKATFEMWIDATCLLSRRWGVKGVGFCVLLDEDGCVMAVGDHPGDEFFGTVKPLIAEKPPAKSKPEPRVDTRNTTVEIHMQACTNFLGRKRRDDAVASLKKALALDPENKVIWKQVWVVENPDKFYAGAIDKEWQRRQPPVLP